MGLMQRLGGRKFLLIVGCIAIAVVIELKGPRGLTPEMAGFLVAISGMFVTGNVMAQSSYMKGQGSDSLQDKIDDVHDMVKTGMSPEAVQDLATMLGNINQGLQDVKQVTAQTGQAILSLKRN